MNAVLGRKRVAVPGYKFMGQTVHAASIIETHEGHEAVLIVEGFRTCRNPGSTSFAEAQQKIFDLLEPPDDVPDFLVPAGWMIEEKPKAEPIGAKLETTSSRSIVNGRVHSGSTTYVITGETLAEVEQAVASICAAFHPAGYGTRFDEIELVDGVYRTTGSHQNNCD